MPEGKFIGLYVPDALEMCIRIQSLLLGKGNKSDVVREIIQKHALDNDWTVENLVERYAKHMYSQWDYRYRDSMSFRDYMADQRIKLREARNLPPEPLKIIIEKCEEIHRLNQSLNK